MIELPLPFMEAQPTFPNNRTIALKRTESTFNTMKKDPEFFQKALDKFALNVDRKAPRFEPVPKEHRFNKDGRAYYIPQFSVNQKGKARIVFDSAAKKDGVCINDVLRQGPDRNNALRGVIHRFRRHPYAITADVENMFHQFAIPDEQKTAYEIRLSLVGSEMCIRDSLLLVRYGKLVELIFHIGSNGIWMTTEPMDDST